MVNWLNFVKDYREKHPELSYKEALTICSPLYKSKIEKTLVPAKPNKVRQATLTAHAEETGANAKPPQRAATEPPMSVIEKPKRKRRAVKKPRSVEVKIQIESEAKECGSENTNRIRNQQ